MPEGDATTERELLSWRRAADRTAEPPLVKSLPYLELALEHPSLEPVQFGDAFFPDAVPYQLGDEFRVFYWQSIFRDAGPLDGTPWDGVCATPDRLLAITGETTIPLTSKSQSRTEVVVDGTVAGDSTRTVVSDYRKPDIEVSHLSETECRLRIDGAEHVVPVGKRTRFTLDEQTVETPTDGTTTCTPELRVRFAGVRTLHHPALESHYLLFPSFGLSLDDVPNPLPVPISNDELDYERLADGVDIDLDDRPYPERVLWQAFAYTAFDPHRDAVATVQQLDTGHFCCWPDSTSEP